MSFTVLPSTFTLLLLALVQAPQDDKKVLALIEELKLDDPAARRKALDGLVDRGKDAVALAIQVLADERPGLDAQVDDLVGKLASREWKERDAAQKAIARIGRHARARLQKHESSQDPEVAWRVKAALAEIEERERDEASYEYLRNAGLCEFLGLAGDGRAAPLLVKQLEQGTTNPSLDEAHRALRVRAAEALGRLRAALSAEQANEVAEKTADMLTGNRDRRQCAILVQTLGRLRSEAAETRLLQWMRESRDVHLRRSIMRALTAIGQPRGAEAIIRSLSSDDVYLRDAAIEVLSEAAGQDFGLDPRQAPEAAADRIKAARDWWSKKYGKDWPEE